MYGRMPQIIIHRLHCNLQRMVEHSVMATMMFSGTQDRSYLPSSVIYSWQVKTLTIQTLPIMRTYQSNGIQMIRMMMNVRMLGHFVCSNVHNSEVNTSVIVKDISYTGRFNEQDFF